MLLPSQPTQGCYHARNQLLLSSTETAVVSEGQLWTTRSSPIFPSSFMHFIFLPFGDFRCEAAPTEPWKVTCYQDCKRPAVRYDSLRHTFKHASICLFPLVTSSRLCSGRARRVYHVKLTSLLTWHTYNYINNSWMLNEMEAAQWVSFIFVNHCVRLFLIHLKGCINKFVIFSCLS